MSATDQSASSKRVSGVIDRLQRFIPAKWRRNVPVVPVVRLGGAIGVATPLRPGLSLAGVAKILERAFSTKGAQAVAISINSPGGSPVQSHFIYSRIRQLASEKNLPVLVFVEDVAAYLGSIGVVGGSFGFEELIKKIGVERRLYTSGEHKAMLDPFLPQNPDDVARLKAIQRLIHDDFIALVKRSRTTRLKAPDDELFTGEYWTGERAIALGLADSIGDLRGTLRLRFGDKVKMPLIAPAAGLMSSLMGRRGGAALQAAFDIGALARDLPDAAISAAEERALWARYGF